MAKTSFRKVMEFLNGVQNEIERYREAYRLTEAELIKRDEQILKLLEELKRYKEPVDCREVEKALRAEIKRLEEMASYWERRYYELNGAKVPKSDAV